MSVSKLGRLERGEVRLTPKDKSRLTEVANMSERELEDFEPHAAPGSQKSARIPAPSDHAPKAHDQLKALREENVFLKEKSANCTNFWRSKTVCCKA